jgi:hypothetical protein
MATDPLTAAILQGLDPGTYRSLSDIQQGNALQQVGQDASPTSKWGAIGRLANAAAGTYLSNSATSDLAKTIAGGKKSAQDQLLAAIEAQSAAARPAAVPMAAPAQVAPSPVAAPVAAAQTASPQSGSYDPAVFRAQADQLAERQPGVPAPAGPYDPATFKAQADKLAVRTNEPTAPLDAPAAAVSATGTAAPRDPGYGGAIANIESGGRYDLLGPVTKSGDRAYGKYQVMGANVPEWTQAILGKKMTPQEFLASPQAQDAVFQGKFGEYAQKYGPEGAAKAWFAGEHGMNNPNAKDQLGTTVQAYADKFMGGLGNQPGVQAIAKAADGQPTQMAQANLHPEVASDAAPAATAKAGGFDVHKLLGVLQNPYTDENTKALVTKLLAAQLTPKEDEFASSPQGIFNKTTGELKKQAGGGGDFGGLQGPELMTALKQANAPLAAQAQAVLEGRVPYPSGSRLNPQQQQLKELVTQIDPNFTAANAKVMQDTLQDYGTKGRTGQARVAANTMLGHADTLNNLVDKLGNYTYFPGVMNKAHDVVAGNTDPEYQKVRGEFETTKKALSTEAEKALAGHTTLAGINEQMSNLDRAKSPEELHSAIHGLVHVLGSRLESMASGFDTSMKTRTQGHEFLDPKGREIFNRFEGINAPASGDVGRIPQLEGGAASPAAAGTTAASPAVPAVGTIMKGHKFLGGDPSSPSSWQAVP